MIIYLTEVSITDHPDYETLFGTPTSSKEKAIEYVKQCLKDEMEDDDQIKIKQISGNQIMLSYEDCLNNYYITAHEVE